MVYLYTIKDRIKGTPHAKLKDALKEFQLAISHLDATFFGDAEHGWEAYKQMERALFDVERSLEALNFLANLEKTPYYEKIKRNLNKSKFRLSLDKTLSYGLLYVIGGVPVVGMVAYITTNDPGVAAGATLVSILPWVIPVCYLIKNPIESAVKNIIKYSKPFILDLEQKYRI
ncbi:MAG: hypothetical protein QMD12_02260 [Candidatus Aenigmarchaeota archaeon]|nr:hypothetical protein [Candidatus Aenigmarchaeota archaeon]